jgi:DNA-binding NtrC family response regulator
MAILVSPVESSRQVMSLRAIAEEAAHIAECDAITVALTRTAGNKSRAARILQTDYKTLHLKMKSLKICAGDFKANRS